MELATIFFLLIRSALRKKNPFLSEPKDLDIKSDSYKSSATILTSKTVHQSVKI